MIACSSLRSALTFIISFLVSFGIKQARPRVKMALSNSAPLFTQPIAFIFFSKSTSFLFKLALLDLTFLSRVAISASSWSLQTLTAFWSYSSALIILSHSAMELVMLLTWALMTLSQTRASFSAVILLTLMSLYLRLSFLVVVSTSLTVESAMRATSWTMVLRSNW